MKPRYSIMTLALLLSCVSLQNASAQNVVPTNSGPSFELLWSFDTGG